jgi:hypothetical protein
MGMGMGMGGVGGENAKGCGGGLAFSQGCGRNSGGGLWRSWG